MKTRLFLRAGIGCVLLAGVPLSVHAASFLAEIRDARGDQTSSGIFYFQDRSYRVELADGGHQMIVLFDAATGSTRLLVPAEKQYMEAGPDAPMSRMITPFGFYAYYARTSEVRAEGVEAIDGVPCTKQVLSGNGQVYCTAWFSEEYGIPLKVEVPLFSETVELRGIKCGPQDATLFAVPADYARAPEPGREAPPAWAGEVASAPLLAPPFDRTVTEGNMIRLKLQAGRTIRLRFTNPRQEVSAFTSVGFKDGQPTSSVSGNTMNLNAGDEVSSSVRRTPDEVDDYIIRVGIGSIRIEATLEPAGGASTPSSSPADPEQPAAGLSAPAVVNMASRFEATWEGPGGNNDYICVSLAEHPPGRQITRASIREGNPVKLWAPNDPGEYELRYMLGAGPKVLVRLPLVVEAVTANVETVRVVKAADWLEVAWNGPESDGDLITLARPGQGDGSSVDRVAVRQGNPARLRAPGEPGEYEVRYLLAHAQKALTRAPLTVEEVTASVAPPATAKPGAEFEVTWTGPGYADDSVTISRPQQSPGTYMASTRLRAGAPARIRAPKEPGTYEVRYILGHGRRLLAKATVAVEAP